MLLLLMMMVIMMMNGKLWVYRTYIYTCIRIYSYFGNVRLGVAGVGFLLLGFLQEGYLDKPKAHSKTMRS